MGGQGERGSGGGTKGGRERRWDEKSRKIEVGRGNVRWGWVPHPSKGDRAGQEDTHQPEQRCGNGGMVPKDRDTAQPGSWP